MCLTEIYTDEDMNQITEELPEVAPGVVEVWKTVQARNGEYGCCDFNHDETYLAGHNIARTHIKIKTRGGTYWVGFHSWPNNKKAKCLEAHWNEPDYQDVHYKIRLGKHFAIKCFVKKEWITAVGQGRYVDVLITSQAFFPTYPATEARLEDFLAWLEENSPKPLIAEAKKGAKLCALVQ